MPNTPQPPKPKYIPFEPPTHLDCPMCDRETDALKEMNILERFNFAFIFYSIHWDEHTACPRCMRRLLFNRLFSNLITANVLWPVFVLPVFAIDMLKTLIKGHSRSIIALYHRAYVLAMKRADWAEEDEIPIDN